MDNVHVNKKKNISKEELQEFTKDELINRIIQLEAHNNQLRNLAVKNSLNKGNKVRTKNKPFDFSKCHYRHILLKFFYLGWDYQGYVTQEDTLNTIEHHLFNALLKTCLIKDRQSSNYHRCGRTDKGVSAFEQVVSIDVRSKFPESIQDDLNSLENEILYCKVLNRVLPKEIQCIAWCPVEKDFSARFDCKSRTYKYFFPRGNLDIEAMVEAKCYLLGTHDFRNFCKMDVGNGVIQFIRNIISIEIQPIKFENSPYDMFEITIVAQSFLWHQIRCIMGILLLIGHKKEQPDIILDLLNIEKYPKKPQYSLASEVPLNLFHCEYNDNENWRIDNETLQMVVINLQQMWTIQSVKATMMGTMLSDLENKISDKILEQSECLIQGVKPKNYIPLAKRPTCESLEDRVEHFSKKRKIDVCKS